MNTNIFMVYILTLTLGISAFYSNAREYFSPIKIYKAQVAELNNTIKKEKFKHLITSYEFADFRAYVATLLPKAIKEKGSQEKSYQLRTLASVVQKHTNENLAYARANQIFEDGKAKFRAKNYSEAAKNFELILNQHPYSAHVPESLFLLVESKFIMQEYDACIRYVNKMLDLYPESELTGYAMLRLGKIYEFQDRHEDAIEIYKTVIKTFPDRGLASAANNNLRSVEL